MTPEKALRNYLTGAVIVWIGILVSAIFILEGTGHLATLLPIMGVGAFWFIFLVPTLFRKR